MNPPTIGLNTTSHASHNTLLAYPYVELNGIPFH